MDDLDMSPPSLDGSASKAVAMSTEIMIITVVVLCFVIALCFFLHMYAKCYWIAETEDPTTVSWRRRIARGRPQPPAAAVHRRGLDPTALQSLPVVVYDPKDFKEGLECAVCLSEVSEGEKARLLPKCNHGFHVECIDMWFKSHTTCPLCRNSVISDNTGTNNNNSSSVAVEADDGSYSSDSSSYYSDNDGNDVNDDDGDSARVVESAIFPTNVLFWGDETQVRSFSQTENESTDAPAASSAAASASSSGVSRVRNRDEMVIDIPSSRHHELCEECWSSPPVQDPAKTPVVTRLGSLRRWLSLGKRGVGVVTPSPRGSSSSNQDQQV